jgi:hypothetical protein
MAGLKASPTKTTPGPGKLNAYSALPLLRKTCKAVIPAFSTARFVSRFRCRSKDRTSASHTFCRARRLTCRTLCRNNYISREQTVSSISPEDSSPQRTRSTRRYPADFSRPRTPRFRLPDRPYLSCLIRSPPAITSWAGFPCSSTHTWKPRWSHARRDCLRGTSVPPRGKLKFVRFLARSIPLQKLRSAPPEVVLRLSFERRS